MLKSIPLKFMMILLNDLNIFKNVLFQSRSEPGPPSFCQQYHFMTSCGSSCCREKENAPDRLRKICQGRIEDYPRCHLASRPGRALWRGTSIPPATDVCRHVAEYSAEAFDCALRGPFDGLFSARIAASRALWKSIAAVIPTSTV